MLEVLRGTAANNGHLNITFPGKALKRDFSLGFATRLAHKDMNLAISLANAENFPLNIGATSTQVFGMARSLGFDNEDYTSVVKVMEQFADVEIKEQSKSRFMVLMKFIRKRSCVLYCGGWD